MLVSVTILSNFFIPELRKNTKKEWTATTASQKGAPQSQQVFHPSTTPTISHNLKVRLHDARERRLGQVLQLPEQVPLSQAVQHLHGDVAVVHQAVHLHS